VEPVAVRGRQYETAGVVSHFVLREDFVAGDVVVIGIVGVAAAVGRVADGGAADAIVGHLLHEAAGRTRFDDLAALVEPGVRDERVDVLRTR
jgi:hypothetical protein